MYLLFWMPAVWIYFSFYKFWNLYHLNEVYNSYEVKEENRKKWCVKDAFSTYFKSIIIRSLKFKNIWFIIEYNILLSNQIQNFQCQRIRFYRAYLYCVTILHLFWIYYSTHKVYGRLEMFFFFFHLQI